MTTITVDNSEVSPEEYAKFYMKWGSLENLSNEQLGALFKEYVGEATHQGWEGVQAYEVRAINRLIMDMALYLTVR
jgi:hypothetical protein